ncbi:MAG: AsnC family transcriptional regulator [Candidatus Bathyarchaeota archaeon]|nr:AsnC family transcriptional regulator [Candidatus Bathyarchaeota archaeon]
MDKTDMRLIMLLVVNSRLPYAELAEKLNLSVNAVHKRVQQLIEAGVIRKFNAKHSLLAENAMVVYVFGNSSLESFQDLPNKLKMQGSIYWLAVGSGKFLYTSAYLRSVAELEQLVSFVKKTAGIPEPVVGIMQPWLPWVDQFSKLKPSDLVLCSLDYQIIRSLKDDARKPIADVADEVGVSAKTVRRRLQRMIKNYLIELSLEWYPDKSNDITTLMELHLKTDVDMQVVPYQIQKKYSPNALYYWCFANMPNTVTFVIWTNSMGELQKLRENLEKEPTVASVVPYILYDGYLFETWRDQLSEKVQSNSST